MLLQVRGFVAYVCSTNMKPYPHYAALLPSSFAMYLSMFAFSYAMEPASFRNNRRTLMATLSFATGAIVGWPFALALAIPFVYEELFVFGTDRVPADMYQSWLFKRWKRFFGAGIAATLIFVNTPFLSSIAIINCF